MTDRDLAPFLDLHFHGPFPDAGPPDGADAAGAGILKIHALLLPCTLSGAPPDNALFTAGIHPKDCAAQADAETLARLWNMKNCIGIGECGLDRRMEGFADGAQKKTFLFQAETAEHLRKPLLIHAVRAGDEIRRLRRNFAPSVPWILHSFRGNSRKADSFLENGFLLSFGTGLFRDAALLEDFFRTAPLDKIFLETDESGEDVRKLYALAAPMLSLDPDGLRRALFQNFKRIFRQT